jgi:TNF receptor-associated protein 1
MFLIHLLDSIIKRYSSFVAFPLRLNGELVNTVGAIWTMDKKDVADAQYDEFYKFISNAHDKPSYRLHFKTDAPLDLKCLFYIPTYNTEKFGMGRSDGYEKIPLCFIFESSVFIYWNALDQNLALIYTLGKC